MKKLLSQMRPIHVFGRFLRIMSFPFFLIEDKTYMNKTKVAAILSAIITLSSIATAADAARPRGKLNMKRPVPVFQQKRVAPPVTNPVPARQPVKPAAAPKAAQPAQSQAPVNNPVPGAQAPAANAASAGTANAAPAQQAAGSAAGGFASNMMGSAIGAVGGIDRKSVV